MSNPQKSPIRCNQLALLEAIKHYKIQLFGTVGETLVVTSSTPNIDDYSTLKRNVGVITEDPYVVGYYICGKIGDINMQYITALSSIKQHIGGAVILLIDPEQSIENNVLVLRAYTLNDDQPLSVKSLVECDVVVDASSLQRDYVQKHMA
ncbi:Uncharacterized protein QTN25_010782 [Entamoeba marina]